MTFRNINAAEVALIIEELDLNGSILEDIRQHNFSDLTLTFYRKTSGRVHLFVSLSNMLRMYSVHDRQPSTKKLQRFIQFTRANVTPSRVVSVGVVKGEREIKFTLVCAGVAKNLYVRLFSGSRANVIVTDSADIIEEAFFRRPDEKIIKGALFVPSASSDSEFEVRQRIDGISFNEQLRSEFENSGCSRTSLEYNITVLTKYYEVAVQKIDAKIFSLRRHIENTDIERLKQNADELSFTSENGKDINSAYERIKQAKRVRSGEEERLKVLENEKLCLERDFKAAVASEDIALIEKQSRIFSSYLSKEKKTDVDSKVPMYVSSSWQIYCGRNARENDYILRHIASGNDLWLHIRGKSGGYVVVKMKKGKTVPLPVLLDAAELALYYSSSRTDRTADLHKTYVKYLKRVKGGKTGQVIVERDESFFLHSDKARLKKLFESAADGG